MLSSESIDIRVVGESLQKAQSLKASYFVTLKIDGRKVLDSTKVPSDRALHWNEQKIVSVISDDLVSIGADIHRSDSQFAPASVVEFGLYRQGRHRKWKEYTIAECNARGGDFLQTGSELELVNKSGEPCLAVKFDIVMQSHSEFMKDVNEQVAKLANVKGIDAAQQATTLIPKLGVALEKIVPVLDKFAGMAQNQKQEDGNVQDLVDSLCEMAGAASSCPDLKKIEGTTDVAEEIGKASLEAAILVHDYVSPSIRGQASFFARTAKHSLSAMSSRIAKSQKRCQALTDKLDRRVAIDMNGRMKDVQNSDRKRDIHVWMQAPDTSPNYNAARKKHQPGTGSWFLDGPEFSQWKEQPGSVLWLYGGPGSGKTILCSSAIENIQTFCEMKPSTRGYAYFFFDGTRAQSDALNYDNLTRSIITQLSDRCGDAVPTALVDMYSKCDSGHRQPLEAQLENTLFRILNIFDDTYITIDSLDECVKKADVLRWIRSITSDHAERLHVMLTSRPEPEITRGLTSLSNLQKISIRDQSSAGDIDIYLDARLNDPEMDQWDEHEKQIIKKTVSDGSEGMFRWVTLQMDDIMKCCNNAQLVHQLETLPKDLDATYAKIFEQSNEPDTLKTLLQWLVFAVEPMSMRELAEVLAVDFNGDDSPLYKSDMRYKRPAEILRICYGLVDEFNGTVKLAHFSVKEYFIQHITSEQLSHSIIAQTCLAQLLHFDGPSILDWERPGSVDVDYIRSLFPLAIYAAMNWVSHFQSSGAAIHDCPPLQQLLLNLFTLPSTTWSYALLSWVRLQNLILDDDLWWHENHGSSILGRTLMSFTFMGDKRLPPDASPLYYACFTGSLQAVLTLVSNGADVNKAGCEAATRPLLIASSEGHLEIVNVLLEKGADINVKGGRYGTALQAASAGGHLEITKLLLENGADVNITGEFYGSALQEACKRGHLEIAKLLLENGADVTNLGGEYGSALQTASKRGHLGIAKLLLENGADVNIAGGRYGSALQGASAEGHLEIAKLLLENGADVNMAGGFYGSALQAASAEGRLEIAKLLLENGADVSIAGGYYGSALQAASAGGHLEITKLLLENGADMNIVEGDYGSALVAASACQRVEIVKLLLENGADVNIVGGEYGLALQAASAEGHLGITKLLLENGADVNMAGGFHGSALQAACKRGHLEIAKLLLENGADVNIVGGFYGSALQAASAGGHLKITKLLLENGADVNVAGGTYSSALQAASTEGRLEIAKLLLENGADVNIAGEFYASALQAASARGHLEITKLLLENGADVTNLGGDI
ncbi:hypothetical protein HWV62_13393 [Athelia sp. TMB]|nr:hypothetical protein HWV62_13393 [Athelia sp. TMB]